MTSDPSDVVDNLKHLTLDGNDEKNANEESEQQGLQRRNKARSFSVKIIKEFTLRFLFDKLFTSFDTTE